MEIAIGIALWLIIGFGIYGNFKEDWMLSECCNSESWNNMEIVDDWAICGQCMDHAGFYDFDVDVDENGPFIIKTKNED